MLVFGFENQKFLPFLLNFLILTESQNNFFVVFGFQIFSELVEGQLFFELVTVIFDHKVARSLKPKSMFALGWVYNVGLLFVYNLVLESKFLLSSNEIIDIGLNIALMYSPEIKLVFDGKKVFSFLRRFF